MSGQKELYLRVYLNYISFFLIMNTYVVHILIENIELSVYFVHYILILMPS